MWTESFVRVVIVMFTFFSGSVFHFSLLLSILSHPSTSTTMGQTSTFFFSHLKKDCASFELPLGDPEFFRSWLQLMLSLDLKMSLGLEYASWFGLYRSFIQKHYWVSVVCQVQYSYGVYMVTRHSVCCPGDHVGTKSTGTCWSHCDVKCTRIRVNAWFFEGI